MSATTAPNMLCPGCGLFQPRSAACVSCGIIVAKVLARRAPAARPKVEPVGFRPVGRSRGHSARHVLARLGHAFLAGTGSAVALALYLVVTPQPMSVGALARAQEIPFHLREFHVEGRVISTHRPGLAALETGDGQRLRTLEIAGGGATAVVSYDPREIRSEPVPGTRVAVEGLFVQVTRVERRHGHRVTTGLAVARSIVAL